MINLLLTTYNSDVKKLALFIGALEIDAKKAKSSKNVILEFEANL